MIPSIDDFTLTEIMNFVDELKHEHLKDQEDGDMIDSNKKAGENGGSGEISDN